MSLKSPLLLIESGKSLSFLNDSSDLIESSKRESFGEGDLWNSWDAEIKICLNKKKNLKNEQTLVKLWLWN